MMEYYSAIKKAWNNAICSYVDRPRDYHTKWSKSHKGRQILYHLYVESEKTDSDLGKSLWLPKGKER